MPSSEGRNDTTQRTPKRCAACVAVRRPDDGRLRVCSRSAPPSARRQTGRSTVLYVPLSNKCRVAVSSGESQLCQMPMFGCEVQKRCLLANQFAEPVPAQPALLRLCTDSTLVRCQPDTMFVVCYGLQRNYTVCDQSINVLMDSMRHAGTAPADKLMYSPALADT